MADKIRVCFDMENDEFLALQGMAEVEDVEYTRYIQAVVSRHVRLHADEKAQLKNGDRRIHPRVELSIPAVSCVKFSDMEMRSYPVVVEDISKGGIRISFKSVTQELAQKMEDSSHFEIVFTVPRLSQTVSLYCKRLRYNMDQGVTMVGVYEGDNSAPLSLMNDIFEHPQAYLS